MELLKRCSKCGEEKSADLFYRAKRSPDSLKASCKQCHNDYMRARWAALPPEKRRAVSALNIQRRTATQKRTQRKRQRARWVAKGLTTNGTQRIAPPPRVYGYCGKASAVALRAVAKLFTRFDSGECGRLFHEHTGKPWNWRGYSEAEKWKLRYRVDDEFRAREIFKAQTIKAQRAARIATTDDGSITPESICHLFGEAVFCPYCIEQMGSADKSLDHVHPLHLGGAHSLDNAVVCCKSCNFSKGRKPLIQWLMGRPSGPGNKAEIAGYGRPDPKLAPMVSRVPS